MKRQGLLSAALLGAGLAGECNAVSLDGDGLGQALVYPYFTTRFVEGNSWNTYISVVNHRQDTKVLRVRAREGRSGREVSGFNLFLAPNDAWTAALVPPDPTNTSAGKIISADRSCANPPVSIQGATFSAASYSGANADGLGDGLDRTREGYIEIIEMATLTGAAAATVNSGPERGLDGCAPLQGESVPLVGQLAAPTGGLSGTLTLINVNSGMDLGVAPMALANLTANAFYRNYNDPYPDFNAAEVVPASTVVATDGKTYRLLWSSGVEAVTSVLMATEFHNEFVLEANTGSQTEWILTAPTKRFYAEGQVPFERVDGQSQRTSFADREGSAQGNCPGFDFPSVPPCPAAGFKAASVVPFGPAAGSASRILGSLNVPSDLHGTTSAAAGSGVLLHSRPNSGLVSAPGSTARGHFTGTVDTGTYRQLGLPLVGFMVRTFTNGTLTCTSGSCQGNYGGAFPHRYVRSVVPVP